MADAQLIQYFERIESLEDQRKDLKDDQKDVFLEAKSQGYDTKMMRAILVLRGMDPEKRQEWEALLETYKDAAGLA